MDILKKEYEKNVELNEKNENIWKKIKILIYKLYFDYFLILSKI